MLSPDRNGRPAPTPGIWRLLAALLTGLLTTMAGPAAAEPLRIGGTGSALGMLRELGRAFNDQHPEYPVQVLPSMDSGGGIKGTLAGALQLGISARPLKDAERTAGAQALALGRTPFVFAVSPDRPEASVASTELNAIYGGARTTWPDGTRIRIVLRPPTDADAQLLRAHSAGLARALQQAHERPGNAYAHTDQDAADRLEQVRGAFGAITLTQLLTEHRALKPLALDGVAPDRAALASGRYPLAKTLWLVHGQRLSPAAAAFLDFVRSPAAQALLATQGVWSAGAQAGP